MKALGTGKVCQKTAVSFVANLKLSEVLSQWVTMPLSKQKVSMPCTAKFAQPFLHLFRNLSVCVPNKMPASFFSGTCLPTFDPSM